MNIKHVIGKTFGRLLVIDQEGDRCTCLCECGRKKSFRTDNLRSGGTRSCGCLRNEVTSLVNTKHGRWKTREYRCWYNIRSRCYYPGNHSFHYSGGRCTVMCPHSNDSFLKFYEDMGPCPKGFQIDRIDNNGNYTPSNCRWTDILTNSNNRRTSHFIESNGERHTIAEWSRINGVNLNTVFYRLRNGVSPQDAIIKPL